MNRRDTDMCVVSSTSKVILTQLAIVAIWHGRLEKEVHLIWFQLLHHK